MARRVFILSIVAGLALATAAFASGQKDITAAPLAATTGEKITLTGALSFTNLVHPTLKSGDKVYTLLVPRRLIYQSSLKEGANVSVEGYQATVLPPWADVATGTIAVYVTKATIDGKEYDLSQFRGRMMGAGRDDDEGYGPGRGMMGGWGGMMGGWLY
jgi:hypothetical protein